MTDSCATLLAAPRRTVARFVPPSTAPPYTANDTAPVARDPSEANSLGAVTRSRTRIAAAETAQRQRLREVEASPERIATNARRRLARYRQTLPESPESPAPTVAAAGSPLRLPPPSPSTQSSTDSTVAPPPMPHLHHRHLHPYFRHQCHRCSS
jgi:hypothetical protein